MSYTKCFAFLFVVLAINIECPADVIVGYDAADTVFLTPINGPGVSGTNLIRADLNQVGGGGNDFNSSGWSSNPTNSYLEFGFTSTTQWNLDSLLLRGLRSDSGPPGLTVYASINGGAFSAIDTESIGTSAATVTFDLASLDSVDSAIFRLFSTLPSGTGTLRISEGGNLLGTSGDLVLTGVAVPEPASAAFLASLLLAGMARTRFRMKSQLQ